MRPMVGRNEIEGTYSKGVKIISRHSSSGDNDTGNVGNRYDC